MSNTTFEVFREAVWEGHPVSAGSIHARTRAQAQATFLKGMLEMPSQHERRNPLEWAASLMAHIIIVAAVVLAPFFFTQVIDLRSFQTTFLVAPLSGRAACAGCTSAEGREASGSNAPNEPPDGSRCDPGENRNRSG